MIIISRLFSILLVIFSASCLFADEQCSSCPASISKLYVADDQICLKEGKILVDTENGILIAPAIYSDEKGLFIVKCSKEREDCKSGEWWCSKCEECIKNYYFLCPNCSVANFIH